MPSASAFASTAIEPGIEVVVEHPVGQHVRRVTAALGDEVGEAGTQPALVLGSCHRREPYILGMAVRKRLDHGRVPLVTRDRTPRRIPQQLGHA